MHGKKKAKKKKVFFEAWKSFGEKDSKGKFFGLNSMEMIFLGSF